MAEEPTPSFLGQPDEVRNKKYDNLLSDLTSQTVGGYSFSNISDAIKEAEVGGDKNATGWPYIFTKSGKTSSAFGPIQITYSTVLDYFVGAGKEKDQLARFRAGDFVEGYSQLPADVKSYLKSFVEQGIKKRNNKKPQDGGAYGNLGIGDISKADHEKYYPFLVGVHIREKKKIAKDDTVPSFVNAHYGSVEHSNESIQTARTSARNRLQKKVNEALDIEAIPTTEADAESFTELEQYVPATAKPEPSPAVPDAVSKGQPSAERAITIDYEGEMPDVGDDVPLPAIAEKDVAPDTTDAIPTAEPEEKGLFSRAISGVGEFLFGDDDDTSAEPKVDKNEIIRRSLLKELDTSGVPNMNKGGMPMERQMDMFDEGGLLDEGGTIDEQSGNDVPPGSLKEEVRDDIPAQLSEGEFVFPADVVRYWGLEKLMEMRQEAKAGLARMDAMGQMGNSEEATIPDDLPFTLDDLDTEDDPMEFQVGGLVPNQFGVTEQPSQFATYNPQPYVAPTIPAGQPIQQQPLQTGFTPLTTPSVPTDGTVVPTFEQLLPTTTGRYDELKEYINNDTGQTMTIPFVDGKPIYPIPEGFVEVQTDVVEAVETPSITVPTARVVEEDPSDKPDDGLGLGGGRIGMGGFSDGTGRKQDATIMGVSFDGMGEGVLGGIGGAASVAASLATGKPIPAKASATFTYDNETYTVSGTVYNDLKKAGYKGDLADKIVATLKTQSGVKRGSVDYDVKTGTFKDKRSGETFQDKDDDGDGIGDILSKTGQSIYSNVDSDDLVKSGQKLNSSQKAVASAYNDAVFDAFFEDDDDDNAGGGTPSQDFSQDISPEEARQQDPRGESSYGGGYYRAKGGLIKKPKPKAKKMKRGGLASKK